MDTKEQFEVGDRVSLHAFKAKKRRVGTVVRVGRTRIVIEVRLQDGGWARETTRYLDDPDLVRVGA